MPRGDGTGPPQGGGSGAGRAMFRRGKGVGRMGGTRAGAGPDGECVCPGCGARVAHQVGGPCYSMSCPRCGTKMVRA